METEKFVGKIVVGSSNNVRCWCRWILKSDC